MISFLSSLPRKWTLGQCKGSMTMSLIYFMFTPLYLSIHSILSYIKIIETIRVPRIFINTNFDNPETSVSGQRFTGMSTSPLRSRLVYHKHSLLRTLGRKLSEVTKSLIIRRFRKQVSTNANEAHNVHNGASSKWCVGLVGNHL